MKALAPVMQVCQFQCVPESLPCFCFSFVLKILCLLESEHLQHGDPEAFLLRDCF